MAALTLLMLPFEIRLALIEERTILSVGSVEVSTNDVIVVFSLAAGSVALATFFTEVILPHSKKIRRRR